MSNTRQRARAPQILVTLAALVIVVAGMREAQAILLPLILAVILAVISTPAMFWLKRIGVPAGIAVILIVLGMLGIGLGIGALMGTSLNSFSANIPFYQARLQADFRQVLAWVQSYGIDISSSLVFDLVNPGDAMSLAAKTLTGLGGVFTNTLLILLTIVFILLEASSFPAKLRAITGDPRGALPHFTEFTESVNRYLKIKTGLSLMTGLLITIWVWALGIDYPMLWGMLAFLLNYIPNIGSIIAAVPAVLLALVQLGPGSALFAAGGYVVVNVVIGSLIEPRFMGQGLGLSTLVVFLSLVVWGWVWGVVGMLLSIPLTMTLKIALASNEETRWIAVLLGPPIAEEQEQVQAAETSEAPEDETEDSAAEK
jgi:predicted PurR-regulated permease PerM